MMRWLLRIALASGPARRGGVGVLALLVLPRADAVLPGLVHHWNFDEGPDWHDSAFGAKCTNTVALDCVGGAAAVLRNMGSSNWVSGRQFTALEFDGVNHHLAVTTNLAATLGGTASLSLWLRTAQTGAPSAATAPGIAGVAGPGGTQWGWLDDTGRVGLAVDNQPVARSTHPINDGRWHHVVLTRDSATGGGQVYVDGALSDSATGPTGIRSAAFASLAQVEAGADSWRFRGRLDQVHVFNRVLSAAEVATLRTNHAPKLWDTDTEGVNHRAFNTISTFAKSYDVERDPLAVSSWTQPAHGSVTPNGDGSFTYTPANSYVGSDRFRVTVTDGKGGFHTATMNVAVMSEPPGGGGVPVTQFTGLTPVQAAGKNLGFSGIRVPRAIDWNRDGRSDLLVGAGGSVWLFLFPGTPAAPPFAPGVKVKAAGADISSGDNTSPIALADMTGDGVNDLVLTDSARKLRVYRNTAPLDAPPVYAAPTFVKTPSGAQFVAPDRRFDLGDWNGDGRPDLVTGTFSGSVQLFLNSGTASDPRFGSGTTLFEGSYQLYPRLFDLNANGFTDLLRGINWGDVAYWRDPDRRGLNRSMTLTITDASGAAVDLHGLTDGPVVDFGDFTGDGIPDLVVGGQGGGTNLFMARGVQRTVAQSLAAIEAIYDANLANLGAALSANNNALLNTVNTANWNLVSHLENGTLGVREALDAALTAQIRKYAFLKYRTLDTTQYHHVPSIVLQNWVLLAYALPDTPPRRIRIADLLGLVGTARTVFLENGLAIGDNAKSIPAAYGTLRDFLRRHPRELFPDAVLTIDQLYGDGRGGFVWTPNSTKNTFGDWAVGSANEWAADLTAAIERILGPGAASGDYFTFVAGHEISHSLDHYVNSRANADLRKRWGLTLSTAAGPDIVPGADGWLDWTATQGNFRTKGYWDGNSASWQAAWSNYWVAGVGAPFRNTSFMRGGIDWFLDAPQESLATQANHHWANAPGRLIGAVDRFRRAAAPGLGPLRANINEVVTFIDFLSAGMNRVNLVETKYQASPKQVNWFDHYADLERDDRGYIQCLTVDGRTYQFDLDARGVVTNVATSLLAPANDRAWTLRDTPRRLDILANDSRLEGGPVLLAALNPPVHGVVTPNADGTVTLAPAPGFSGNDRFTYSVTSRAGGTASATADIEVVNPDAASGTMLVEYWHNIGGGTAVNDLTGNARFPASPTVKFYTNSAFELRSNYGDNFGARARAQFVAPLTGSYRFWIASDDSSELWFSPNADTANLTLIASVSGWTDPRQWTKFASQQSAPIPLDAGQSCALEALYKEGVSLDCLAVAWQGPAPYTTTNVIAATRLRHPFAGFSAPRFNADPLAKPFATLNRPYAASLAADVTDANPGEIFVFAKLAGPAWIAVAPDGTLSGTPGPEDLGHNTLELRVWDSTGFVDDATVSVWVWDPAPPALSAAVLGASLQLQIAGATGQPCRIEYQPAVPPAGAWLVLTDLVALTASPHTVVDSLAAPRRFYRAVSMP